MAGAGRGPEERRPAHSEAARVAGVGLQFAASIVIFLLVGQWLDDRLGTEPWLLIVGVMVGAAAGFFSLYRQLTGGPKRPGPDGREDGERR